MSQLKTVPNSASVKAFIDGIEDDDKRADARELLKIMREVTGKRPKMWGDSIVGFGSYHYKYASGREGDWFVAGFSPRKQALTLYIMAGFSRFDELLGRLGTYTHGKSCLYVKKLDDVDREVLRELIAASVEHVSKSTG
ncbi:MAG: DUF1801 domain-containing protein [Rhodothermales bacterium]|nr:DUF1801 domain-containing protein [Rhodothermales bacterium]